MSLRARLLWGLLPVFVLGLFLSSAATYGQLQSYLTARLDGELISAHQTIEAALGGVSVNGAPASSVVSSIPLGTYAEVRSPSGQILKQQSFSFSTMPDSSLPQLSSTLQAPAPGVHVLFSVSSKDGKTQYRVLADQTHDNSGDILIVALPQTDVAYTLQQLFWLELAIGFATLVVLVISALLIVRRSLRPLRKMSDTARSIVASADLTRRIEPANEKTEIGKLGTSLNVMLTQIATAFAQKTNSESHLRQFVAETSHELRTPLTSMRGYAELFRRNPNMDSEDKLTVLKRIEEESIRMSRLVDDLLTLARLDQNSPLQKERVSLAPLVHDAVADMQVTETNRMITAQVEEDVAVDGEEGKLRQVLANLLRNALVHTPAGTPIEVWLGPVEEKAVIRIVDHGPGIPEEKRGEIFERYHRANPEVSRDQGGAGLSLSIVAAVVAAHEGTIEISTTEGGGATFTLAFPMAKPL